MANQDQKAPEGTAPVRDDAQAQPESGYPEGHLSTKPSVELRDEKSRQGHAGSESEFDSEKPRS